MRARSVSPKPMIGQHDDRAFYHRRRWEHSERSGMTSASWTVSNRCDWRCSHDRAGCIRRVRTVPLDPVPWKYLFSRCGTKAAIRHITQKLKYVPFLQRVTLWNYGDDERRFHAFAKFVPC